VGLVVNKATIKFPATPQTRRYISCEILLLGKQQQPETGYIVIDNTSQIHNVVWRRALGVVGSLTIYLINVKKL